MQFLFQIIIMIDKNMNLTDTNINSIDNNLNGISYSSNKIHIKIVFLIFDLSNTDQAGLLAGVGN